LRGNANPIPTAAKCWRDTGRVSRVMRTCEPCQLTFDLSTFSPGDSPANPCPSPGPVGEPTTTGGCGPNIAGSLAYLDHASSSWKTCQGSLFAEWATFCGTWPFAGTTRSGIAFPRRPLVRDTFDTEYSLWPTPVAQDTGRSVEAHLANKANFPDGWTRHTITSLRVMAKAVDRGLWPTPTAGDAYGSGARNLPGSNAHVGVSLTDAVVYGDSRTPHRWPTPTARLAISGTDSTTDQRPQAGGMDLRSAVVHSQPDTPTVGQLNPTWVEWLMGFPEGWTDCER
jgi:hypothetical protein